jgi:hypothetical protein
MAQRFRPMMRLLLLANEALGSPRVVDEVAHYAERKPSDVLLVAPTPRAHGLLAASTSAARRRARKRIRGTVDALTGLGIPARGELGPPEPLEALEAASRAYAPQEVILTTYPPDQSEWSVDELLSGARERLDAPVHHLIVEPSEHPDRVAPSARIIRLYHFAEPEDAERLRAGGLAGEDPAGGLMGGVWMIASRAGRRPEGRVAFAMDVPLSAVKRYEREPGFHDERRFFVPAGVLSRLGPLVPVGDEP